MIPTEPKTWTWNIPTRPLQAETVILVSSLTRAIRFYSQVFQYPPERTDKLCGTAQYSLPERIVTLKADKSHRPSAFDTEIRVQVRDFLYEFQRLQQLGVGQLGSVTENARGETCMTITDEDGNILSIVARDTFDPK